MASAPHRANILTRGFREVGLAASPAGQAAPAPARGPTRRSSAAAGKSGCSSTSSAPTPCRTSSATADPSGLPDHEVVEVRTDVAAEHQRECSLASVLGRDIPLIERGQLVVPDMLAQELFGAAPGREGSGRRATTSAASRKMSANSARADQIPRPAPDRPAIDRRRCWSQSCAEAAVEDLEVRQVDGVHRSLTAVEPPAGQRSSAPELRSKGRATTASTSGPSSRRATTRAGGP